MKVNSKSVALQNTPKNVFIRPLTNLQGVVMILTFILLPYTQSRGVFCYSDEEISHETLYQGLLFVFIIFCINTPIVINT